jgi:hypothetical protein
MVGATHVSPFTIIGQSRIEPCQWRDAANHAWGGISLTPPPLRLCRNVMRSGGPTAVRPYDTTMIMIL